jgi:hypothetical protein
LFAQEFKDGYGFLSDPDEFLTKMQLPGIEAQANRQLSSLRQSGSSARLEWHFSDQGAADAVYADFQSKGIPIDVYYSPWPGQSAR